jgi:hypothetical protein
MAAIVPDPPPEVPQTMESARLHAEIARLNLRLGAQHGAYELKFETQQAEIARLRGDLDEVEAGKGRLVKECVRLRTQLANVLKEHRERLQANAGLRAELEREKSANLLDDFVVTQGEKILAERDSLRAELDYEKKRANLMGSTERDAVQKLNTELAAWQHNYLHLRSLLGVDREDGETDAHLWQRTETALRKMRNVLAAARQEIHDKSLLIDVVHQERDTARADLAAARQDADRLLSLVNDLGVRLKSSQADTELLRNRLISARQDANRLLEALDELHAFVEREHDLINNPNCPTCVALRKASDVLRTSPPLGNDLIQAKGGSDMGLQESLA